MTSFQNQNSFPIYDLNEIDKTVSTLLIPAHLIPNLKSKLQENGLNLLGYLKHLLRHSQSFTHSGMLPPPRKIKTEYQDEGLDLKRVSFRVRNSDWLELGELALAFGKSRCWVFTFLLELDLLGFWETLSEFEVDNAVPTSTKFRLRVSLSLRRISQNFARSYHVRV